MITDWGTKRGETLSAVALMQAIINREIETAITDQRQAHAELSALMESGEDPYKSPHASRWADIITKTSGIIAQSNIIRAFLDHVRAGSL